jgi:hypothetical protein
VEQAIEVACYVKNTLPVRDPELQKGSTTVTTLQGVQFPLPGKDFSLFHKIKTGSAATKAMDSESTFPGINMPRHESDKSSFLMQRLKIRGAIPPLSRKSAWCGR